MQMENKQKQNSIKRNNLNTNSNNLQSFVPKKIIQAIKWILLLRKIFMLPFYIFFGSFIILIRIDLQTDFEKKRDELVNHS